MRSADKPAALCAIGALLCLPWACAKPAADLPLADAALPPSNPAAANAKGSGAKSSGQAVRSAQALAGSAATAAAAFGPAAGKPANDDLKVEEPEDNPYSENVTLRLAVTPQVKASAMWGGKQLAKLAPSAMEAEIVRPRGSGPIDLEIKADGYLPYHTRLYSDRNEKVSVRLYRAEEAPGLFGYRRLSNPTERKR